MLFISVNDVASYNHSIYTQLAYTISPPNEVRIETSSRSLLLDSSYLPLRTISLILILRPSPLPSNKFYKKFFQHEGLYVTSIASRMSNTSITYDSSPHWLHCRIDWDLTLMNSHQDVRVAISLPTVTKHRSVAIVQLPLNVIAPLTRVRYSLANFFLVLRSAPRLWCQPLQLLAHAPTRLRTFFFWTIAPPCTQLRIFF